MMNIDDLAKRYLAGESLQQLGRNVGVKGDTVGRWLTKYGIKLRSKSEAVTVWHGLVVDDDVIVRRYISGESENAIALSLGIDRSSVRSRLVSRNVAIRDRSDAERLKWVGMTDEQRIQRLDALHSSIIGRYETDLIFALKLAGYQFAQRQIGRYYVDLAHHELLVAIEVECLQGFTMMERLDRLKYILNQGWTVLYVVKTSKSFSLPKVTEKIITFLELASWDESVFGKYGVMDGQGCYSTVGRKNLDGVPRIEGF